MGRSKLRYYAIASFFKYLGTDKLGGEEFGLMKAVYVLNMRDKCDFITIKCLHLAFETIANATTKF